MTHYGQFCPVAKAAEVVAERWTPLIIREMLCGSYRFNDLRRGVPQMSPTLLSQRLKTLERAGIVQRRRPTQGRGWEYHLTEAGEELRPVVMGLGNWGARWVRSDLSAEDLDSGLLMWDMRRRLRPETLPEERVVVHFDFPEEPAAKRNYWLILDRPEVDLCLQFPGYDDDLKVTADLAALTAVWMGDRTFDSVLPSGEITLDGPTELRRGFPSWLARSVFADIEATGSVL